MPTARPFAYNTGSTIAGTTQVGNLAVGYPTSGFSSTGLQWWNGPDEELGYVIAVPVPDGGQPNPLGISARTGFYRSSGLTDQAFINVVNSAFSQNLGTTSACLTYLSTNGYWTSYSQSVGVTFSQPFVQSAAPTNAVEIAWNTFRAALTGTYTTFTMSSTNGSSVTATHPTNVQTLANALRNATNNTSVTINSVIWRVGTGCGTPKIGGVAVEFSNIASCSASSTVALRPMINNLNWGGIGTGSTVSQASQTITLTFS